MITKFNIVDNNYYYFKSTNLRQKQILNVQHLPCTDVLPHGYLRPSADKDYEITFCTDETIFTTPKYPGGQVN